ncbi:MAG: ImmA/IrrE family metallo-endopeptidase, partial [Chloroflexi bacterium]|nr:ImmA/IrrE family metallo-endopeptidase [Chloroflexota bacterium]
MPVDGAYLPGSDGFTIFVNKNQSVQRQRFSCAHEIGHAITPWHHEFLMGDSETELSPACHATIEAEANYTCGQLLFLRERFVDEVMS